MANKKKAEVEITLSGEVYTLRFGYNEICELDDLLNGWQEAMTKRSASFVRAAIFVAMRKKDRKLTLERVGNLLEGCSLDERIEQMTQLANALSLAYTGETTDELQAKIEGGEVEPSDPPEVTRLTGTSS